VLGCATTAFGQAAAPASAPAPSAAQEQEARGLFELGRDAYQNARYDRALEYFKQSYALSGRAALLNNIGAAADRLRHDQEAIDAYQKYLDQVPGAENREAIQNRITALKAGLASQQATPALVPTPQQTALAAPPPPAQPAPITRSDDGRDRGEEEGGSVLGKWWLWAGIGAVVAAGVVVGVVVASGSDKTVDAAPPVVDARTRVIEL
jgi:tetratricopeptide (TPR) repeat protein